MDKPAGFMDKEHRVLGARFSLRSLYENHVFFPVLLGVVSTFIMSVVLFFQASYLALDAYRDTQRKNDLRGIGNRAILNKLNGDNNGLPPGELFIMEVPWDVASKAFFSVMMSPTNYMFDRILETVPWYALLLVLGITAILVAGCLCFCFVSPYIRHNPHPVIYGPGFPMSIHSGQSLQHSLTQDAPQVLNQRATIRELTT